MDLTLLWIPATLAAAFLQTARNAMQRRLTDTIGTLGATQVRFLYGLPFSVVFLAAAIAWTGESVPVPGWPFLPFLLVGAVAQVVATAAMLVAMRGRSFAVVTALLKLEPVIIAVFGFVALGDRPTLVGAAAIGVATGGVVVATWTRRTVDALGAGMRPVVYGLASGALFAAAVVAFRGAILSFADGSALIRASTTLVASLAVQTTLLGGWLWVFARPTLRATWAERRVSLPAGFVGAAASQCWFIGFALTSAANVRTLGLVEVVMAQVVARRVLSQAVSGREVVGVALIAAGVAALIWSGA